jgi:hypothetical protein
MPYVSRNAVQKRINSVPGIAFTEDSLRDVLTRRGPRRRSPPACMRLQSSGSARWTISLPGSEKNRAEAEALPAELR